MLQQDSVWWDATRFSSSSPTAFKWPRGELKTTWPSQTQRNINIAPIWQNAAGVSVSDVGVAVTGLNPRQGLYFLSQLITMVHPLCVSHTHSCSYYIHTLSAEIRWQPMEQAWMSSPGGPLLSQDLLTGGRQGPQSGRLVFSMTVSPAARSAGGTDTSPQRRSPALPGRCCSVGPGIPLGVWHSRERDRFTVRPATHSRTVHRPPFPLHSGCRAPAGGRWPSGQGAAESGLHRDTGCKASGLLLKTGLCRAGQQQPGLVP